MILCCKNATKWSIVWFEVTGTVLKCSLCGHQFCKSFKHAHKLMRTGVFETQKGEPGEDAARKVESCPASEWA